jgi:hypothetical protein
VFDAGYDVTRLAFLLADLPVELCGRLRSDRVLYFPAPPRAAGANGRPSRHGPELRLAGPATWPEPPVTTITETTRNSTAVAWSWDRLHPRLTSRAAWQQHDGELPVIEGTLSRLQVDHLPGDRNPRPVWLWWSATGAMPADIDRCWQAFLRRFDIEHTVRLLKQVLGWTVPAIRDPAAADRRTWLIIACHAQLRLARPLAAGLRRPWEKPAPPGRLAPARVRRGFRNIRATTACPAGAPKPASPAPGGLRAPGTAARPSVTTWERTVTGQISRQRHEADRLNGKLRGLFTGGPVEFQSNDGGDRFREACEWATVVRMKDSPGLQVGDGLLDPVANPAHRLVEFLFPAEKAAVGRFPDGRQHAVPDVALVAYPAGRVEAVQYAGNLKNGRVMAIPVDRV